MTTYPNALKLRNRNRSSFIFMLLEQQKNYISYIREFFLFFLLFIFFIQFIITLSITLFSALKIYFVLLGCYCCYLFMFQLNVLTQNRFLYIILISYSSFCSVFFEFFLFLSKITQSLGIRTQNGTFYNHSFIGNACEIC